MLGVNKVALAYLIRDNPALSERTPPEALPELIGGNAPKPWCTENESLMEKIVVFTPHMGPSNDADKAQLYSILATHLGNTTALASITRLARRRNGRKDAHKDLITHYMGSAK